MDRADVLFHKIRQEKEKANMTVITVTEDKIRNMKGMEGLVLQGCGGSPEEWVDGINGEFTENGILKNGSKFEKVYAFQHDGISCILYPFEGTALDIGKLAVWRIQTREIFGGAWLSDYVPNHLGGFTGKTDRETEEIKPECALSGHDGNIFSLTGIAERTMREHGLAGQAEKMKERVFSSGSYTEALSIIGEYVSIV